MERPSNEASPSTEALKKGGPPRQASAPDAGALSVIIPDTDAGMRLIVLLETIYKEQSSSEQLGLNKSA